MNQSRGGGGGATSGGGGASSVGGEVSLIPASEARASHSLIHRAEGNRHFGLREPSSWPRRRAADASLYRPCSLRTWPRLQWASAKSGLRRMASRAAAAASAQARFRYKRPQR